MKVYLDMCALKRPFDDATDDRVVRETIAVLTILGRIERGVDTLICSAALALENDADPDSEPRTEVAQYAAGAETSQVLTPLIERRAKEPNNAGIRPLDALHVALAEAAGSDALVTCDDRFLKRARGIALIRVLDPIEYCIEVGDD